MDDGYVIPGLNEEWQMLGAKVTEWGAGLLAFMMCSSLVHKVATSMPILLAAWFATTLSLASLRRKFPDEEAGMRNFVLSAIGVPPPGIPTPARLQPVWSGAPMRSIQEEKEYSFLELDKVFNPEPEEEALEDNS